MQRMLLDYLFHIGAERVFLDFQLKCRLWIRFWGKIREFLSPPLLTSLIHHIFFDDRSLIQVPFLNLIANLQERAGQVMIRIGGNTQDSAVFVDQLDNGRAIAKEKTSLTQTVRETSIYLSLFKLTGLFCYLRLWLRLCCIRLICSTLLRIFHNSLMSVGSSVRLFLDRRKKTSFDHIQIQVSHSTTQTGVSKLPNKPNLS